ncbi:uncharacterized protein MEPE_00999 [Melanopsichium pennsylvanicum]|uniref:Protein SQS1 n=2 Tax=Melanopsichium pennsylvanicum TaxID=63383 RepID=A0AAJ4XHL6_9BASI|nr:conserved hypothetical protein [Melanopsichium pennsylvanicum 4]SNX82293.1 uncharacterized protein MEPE_00999 [Melanopsichium pennsylvanicum]
MAKKRHQGRGGGSGSSNRVGRGGERGRGRGRGGGGGFHPFAGAGHVLGGVSSPSDYSSPRGGAANRPYRGRGRGGALSVRGQNRVGFDYSSISRAHRQDYDDQNHDDEQDDQGQDDAADFSIEPPEGYKHKVKPHLEFDRHSEDEASQIPTSPESFPSGSTTPQRNIKNTSYNHPIFPSKLRIQTPRSYYPPTSFPEFYTSRGVNGGANFRPPEETEDSRYLAGIPGLRKQERRVRNETRFGDPADKAQSPFRVPVAFVKATGEFGDPLKGNLPPQGPDGPTAAPPPQLFDTAAEQPVEPSTGKHAGLGFSNRSPSRSMVPGASPLLHAQQTSATPYTPPRAVPVFQDTTANVFDFDQQRFNDEGDQDEVEALLTAFPGSKELAPGESMLDDDATTSWSLPAFHPEVASTNGTAPLASEHETFHIPRVKGDTALVEGRQAARKAASRTSTSSSDEEEEIILVPSQAQTPKPVDATPYSNEAPPAPTALPVTEIEAVEETGLGFVIDLKGEDSANTERARIATAASSPHRVALGDAEMSIRQSRKKAPKRGKPRPTPREGDSDLDWGSDGPPLPSDDEHDLAAATATISISNSHHNNSNAEIITDPILAKAIRADRHEWESDCDDGDISMGIAKPNKRRGGQRAKRSLAGRAAASRNAAQLTRSRKADQDAIVADYTENIMNQAQDSSDEERQALFSNDDTAVETVHGESDTGKGKNKARRLSDKLDDKTDLDAMIRFMNGMDPQKGGRQLGFGDIEDEIHLDEVKEWLTESEDESADEIDAADDGRAVVVTVDESRNPTQQRDSSDEEDEDLEEALRVILEGDDDERSSEIFSEGSSSSSSDDSDSDSDEDEDEDEDEGMFNGTYSWADEDEDFIEALSSQVGGAGIGSRSKAMPSSSKRQQKKLFHAISRGDFSDLMDLAANENEMDSDDPAYGLGSIPTARNGKRKGRKFTSDDLWAEELQQQWDKDRTSKASKKQQRLMERQAAALNPFPNTHGKAGSAGKTKSTKKQAKLARKAEKREMRASLKAHSNNILSAVNAAGSVDAVDQNLLRFGGQSAAGDTIMSLGLDKRFAFNMDELNQQIQMFISEKGRNTMRCQPMDKFARAEVHALAAAYGLGSKSKGKGKDRFPTLIKTSKSGLNVDYRKVKRIVYSNAGATFGNDAGRSDFKDKGRKNKNDRFGGAGGKYGVGGGTVPKNRDGEEVGFGADKIGADNIGHKLLAAMGWTEGSGIGSSQGMANPVGAVVKISRGGLGF